MKRFFLVLLSVLALVAFVLPVAVAGAELPGATCNRGTATAHAHIPAGVPGHEHVPCG